VVEVDVAQQEVPDVGEPEPAVGEARLERVDCRRGSAVEERRPVVGVQEVARDDVLAAEVVQVDRLRRHALILCGRCSSLASWRAARTGRS
jgi:hypothetical protein